MGADTVSTQLIFFIAATVVAAAAAGALGVVTSDLTGKVGEKGTQLGGILTTDVKIANDPDKVPNNPVLIYVKNTGTMTLDASLLTLFINGDVVTTTTTVIGRADTILPPGDVAKLSYAANLDSNADHQARVVTENGVHDDIEFRV